MRVLAISDIHGCLKSFRALLATLKFSKEDYLFLVGDYIDRGPDSKGVIDHIWYLKNRGYKIICLRGNHEQMMLKATKNPTKINFWVRNGGKATLSSFGVSNVAGLPERYIQWVKQLPLYYEFGRYIFVHAGLNFDLPNPLEAYYSMLWARDWYEEINYPWLKDRIIIHGHTPIEKDIIEKMFHDLEENQILDIDAGCVFGYYLCGVDLTNRDLYFQENID